MTVVDDKCQIANKTSLASLQGIKNQGGNRHLCLIASAMINIVRLIKTSSLFLVVQ